ncbi:F/Y rich C-terminus-domain-containing protein, partial [Gautieria morchelliformis]
MPLPPLNPPRPRSTKPKRLKAHTVQSKSYSIPMVPRMANGHPTLPLNVGIMTVKNLGRVCLEKHFHTERYIFPIGYEVTRRYLSMHKRDMEAQYTCTILRGEDIDGGSGPRFRITPSDDLDNPITAGTATGAWSVVVKAANRVRNRQHSNSVSGPDYFGLGQNTIKHLLQQLDGAHLLQDYVRQHFLEGGPLGGRHAAVTAVMTID